MGRALTRMRRRKRAGEALNRLLDRPDRVVVVHYSCESFYDRPDGSSPRVTSIAVRHLETGQTYSFSIHQMAERKRCDIEGHYDELERQMLDEFFEYVKTHPDYWWLHWNMRDINYGFLAIAHRFRVLKGTPVEIAENKRVDLSRLIVDLYGRDYLPHPHMLNLVKGNQITDGGFLPGVEEALAFEQREYVKLHQSTLRKVYVIAKIAELAGERALKTNATWKAKYGVHPQALAEWLNEHWLGTIVGFLSALFGIAAALYAIVRALLP